MDFSIISGFSVDLNEVVLPAILDPIKSPVAAADFVNVFYLLFFQIQDLDFLTFFHIYFD